MLFLIFKTTREPTITNLKFCLRIIDELLTAPGPDRAIVRGRPWSLGTDQACLHIPCQNNFSAFNEEGVSGKFRQCHVCNAANKRTAGGTRVRNEIKYCCQLCGDIPLCPAPCTYYSIPSNDVTPIFYKYCNRRLCDRIHFYWVIFLYFLPYVWCNLIFN